MTDDLLALLAAHRRTLAIYLRQLANLGANNTSPGIYHGIDDARVAIAQLKSELRAAGVEVDNQINDEETAEERALRRPPAPFSAPYPNPDQPLVGRESLHSEMPLPRSVRAPSLRTSGVLYCSAASSAPRRHATRRSAPACQEGASYAHLARRPVFR